MIIYVYICWEDYLIIKIHQYQKITSKVFLLHITELQNWGIFESLIMPIEPIRTVNTNRKTQSFS
jgi:hypothetical protein